uniref:Uncharacterized protein n=1 Tax=Arundo donax TaxID=35708 RepID=A0A0A9G6U8_ARUDO
MLSTERPDVRETSHSICCLKSFMWSVLGHSDIIVGGCKH